MAVAVEVTFYRTETGRRMVLCPCRCKVRVLNDGTLADHWAFDEDFRDPASRGGERCAYRGHRLEEKTGELFGLEFGVLVPETPDP